MPNHKKPAVMVRDIQGPVIRVGPGRLAGEGLSQEGPRFNDYCRCKCVLIAHITGQRVILNNEMRWTMNSNIVRSCSKGCWGPYKYTVIWSVTPPSKNIVLDIDENKDPEKPYEHTNHDIGISVKKGTPAGEFQLTATPVGERRCQVKKGRGPMVKCTSIPDTVTITVKEKK